MFCTDNVAVAIFCLRCQYLNVNYALLGKIVESVSGMDYSSYIETNIFEPLWMTHSFTSLESAKADGITQGHRNYFGVMVEAEYTYKIIIYGELLVC